MPRGPRLTPDERFAAEEDILEALRQNPRLTKTECAEAAGLDYFQLASVLEQNPGFRQRFERAYKLAQDSAIDRVEEAHYKLATGESKDGNVIAQIHLLKHRRSAHYADKTVRGAGGVTVNIGQAQILMAQGAETEIRQIEGDEE